MKYALAIYYIASLVGTSSPNLVILKTGINLNICEYDSIITADENTKHLALIYCFPNNGTKYILPDGELE